MGLALAAVDDPRPDDRGGCPRRGYLVSTSLWTRIFWRLWLVYCTLALLAFSGGYVAASVVCRALFWDHGRAGERRIFFALHLSVQPRWSLPHFVGLARLIPSGSTGLRDGIE